MRKAVLFTATLGVLLNALPASAQSALQAEKQVSPRAGAADKGGAQAPAQQPGSQAKALEGLPIYSSDNQKVGVVKSVEKNSDGSVGTLQAEIEGFLGLGTSSVRLTPDQFKQTGDRVVLMQTAAQVRGMPDANYKAFDRSGGAGAQ